jgi:putative oxidoreductase
MDPIYYTAGLLIQSGILVLIRAILAITFFNEARIKFKDIKKFAKNDSLPVPVAYFIAIAEFCAALSMLTGVLTGWAALGLMLLMLSTICLHIFKWRSPYWASKGGWEYDLLLLTLAAVIFVFGTGPFVLFNGIF